MQGCSIDDAHAELVEEEAGEELLTGTCSLGLEEPTGTPGASSGPEAVRGHFVRLSAKLRISSHPTSILNVVKESMQELSRVELTRAAFGVNDDPDATDGEESGEDVQAA